MDFTISSQLFLKHKEMVKFQTEVSTLSFIEAILREKGELTVDFIKYRIESAQVGAELALKECKSLGWDDLVMKALEKDVLLA